MSAKMERIINDIFKVVDCFSSNFVESGMFVIDGLQIEYKRLEGENIIRITFPNNCRLVRVPKNLRFNVVYDWFMEVGDFHVKYSEKEFENIFEKCMEAKKFEGLAELLVDSFKNKPQL